MEYFTKSFMCWLAADTVASGEEGKNLIENAGHDLTMVQTEEVGLAILNSIEGVR